MYSVGDKVWFLGYRYDDERDTYKYMDEGEIIKITKEGKYLLETEYDDIFWCVEEWLYGSLQDATEAAFKEMNTQVYN